MAQSGEDPAPPGGTSTWRHAPTLAHSGPAGRSSRCGNRHEESQSERDVRRATVDRASAPEFDPVRVSQPSHIYSSTLRRRGRRWSRRRAIWPFALGVLATLAGVALLAGVLLGAL